MNKSIKLSSVQIFLMALAIGLAVASNYFVFPLIEVMARYFGLDVASSGMLITLTQLAYALGLIFLVPLGDLLDNKKLIVSLYAVVSISALLIALAPSLWLFVGGLLLVGAFCTVAQILMPLAASLTAPEQRGRVIGTLMSGLLLGILLSRTFSGLVAHWWGWRMVYVLGAAMLLLMTLILQWKLPHVQRERSALGYWQTLVSVWSLLWRTPLLRQRGMLGALDFCLFSVLWTPLTLLLSHAPYYFSLSTIGLFGLFGALGIFGSNVGGWAADKGHTYAMTVVCALLFLLSWALLYAGGMYLWALIGGVILLDFAIQALHICNQSLIYRSDPALKGRIASGYMSMYFIGGVLGSLASAMAYAHYGWGGVALLGGAIALLILLCALLFKCEHMA
ncbi:MULTISPECIES: MFS transporter [Snodgrassella]|jgi:predicted MFS family arabinose efflux permease|uniref:MFS transporter n=1 Tax=Snodgrassella TaxID=1193515 RepID=UPI000816065E|nr:MULTISPECIES: MFS transporter [Snodgrassella]MCO6513380.1 MFS transporter [Snodgrassella sp.]MCO6518534.1 MFS transporter [Snodgrassella sp.]SCC10605.1 Predicted arabinose efflux permease, MFS family [Snodgrassella sp. R-53583]